MNKYTFPLVLLTSCLFIKQPLTAGPLSIDITNVDLDPARVPQLVIRSAVISSDFHDLTVQTPNQRGKVSATYQGVRQSVGISLQDVTVQGDQLKFYACDAQVGNFASTFPLFSVSEEAESLSVVLKKKRGDYIGAVLTTSPPNLVSLNISAQPPLSGEPFYPQGYDSEDQ